MNSNSNDDLQGRVITGHPIVLLVSAADTEPEWTAEARSFCLPQRARATDDDIDARIRLFSPHVLCFEFGGYDPAGLALLARTKVAHPSIPILMITEEHSEALAIWALRTRVWDFFVKPVAIEELQWALATLHATVTESRALARRRMVRPHIIEGANARADNSTRAERTVEKVRAYVASHLSSKLCETEIAQHCAMSHCHLSRTFHRVSGVTLRDYILRARIQKAAQLLATPGASVTTICFAVGFHDLSHFARMFRRYMGMTPSEYRLTAAGVAPVQQVRLHLGAPK